MGVQLMQPGLAPGVGHRLDRADQALADRSDAAELQDVALEALPAAEASAGAWQKRMGCGSG
jgi:hypothetical protein